MGEQILPPISGHSIVYSEVPRKCIYLFGGWDGKTVYNDLWMFGIEEQSWTRLLKPEEQFDEKEESKEQVKEIQWQSFPKGRISHAACLDTTYKD